MARTSRKGAAGQAAVVPAERIWNTAVYARLSLEDSGRKGADTIEVQIELVESHIRSHPQLQLFDVYTDNGESGKDLSRFGRNYIETCELLDKIFPFMGVRFISVNDGYDSAHSGSTDALIVSLKNLINDKYLRDISRKVSSAYKVRRERGEFTGSFAPFGYKKSSTQKGKLIPDEETAPIVRQIFTWRAEGIGQAAICKRLDEQGIMPPMGWLRERYNVYGTDYYKATVWQPRAVRQMVKSRIYIGDLVQGKTSQALYAHKPCTSVPEADWVIAENAHEPIVSMALWEAANAVGAARRKEYFEDRTYRDLPENLFRGFLCCGVCKSKLSRRYCQKTYQNGQEFKRFYYLCSLKHQHPEEQFSMVPLEIINDLVFTLVSQRLQSVESFGRMIAKRTKRQGNPRAMLDAEIAKATHKLQQTADRLAGLFENYVDKTLSEREYVQFKTDYENKAVALREWLEELSQRATLVEDVSVSENRWLAAVHSFQNPTELTRPMLEALVERIDVYETEKIDIIWKFGDEFARLKACAEEDCCDG